MERSQKPGTSHYSFSVGHSEVKAQGQWQFKPVSFQTSVDDPDLSPSEKHDVEQILRELAGSQLQKLLLTSQVRIFDLVSMVFVS